MAMSVNYFLKSNTGFEPAFYVGDSYAVSNEDGSLNLRFEVAEIKYDNHPGADVRFAIVESDRKKAGNQLAMLGQQQKLPLR